MIRRDHKSAQAARTELVRCGYLLAFTPPGTPSRWEKDGKPYAVASEKRARSTVWHIVPYPVESA